MIVLKTRHAVLCIIPPSKDSFHLGTLKRLCTDNISLRDPEEIRRVGSNLFDYNLCVLKKLDLLMDNIYIRFGTKA